MTQDEMGRMTEWRNRFCMDESPTPVTFVEREHYGGGTIVAGSTAS